MQAAIYVRVSTLGQEENSSLETQEVHCRAYAVERGWNVVRVFREVHTGSELFERPQLSLLRDAARAHECDIVLAYALDRVSRSQAHLGFLLSEWDHLGVQLALVTEDLDDTPEGRLLQSVRGFVAEMERLKIRERSKRGIQARVNAGKPIPGQKAPHGYAWRDAGRTGYVVNPNEQPVVRRIYESVLAGNSLRSIAQQLTREGVPTPTGRAKRWEVATLHMILKNPIYMGRPVAFRTRVERAKGRNIVRYRPPSEWVNLADQVAPSIVTDEEFAAVAQQLARNRETAPRNNANPEATLLRCGIARCGYCGYPLQITKRRKRQHMYHCHALSRERHECPSFGIMAHILDPVVWSAVEQVLLDPDIIAREVERRRDQDPFISDLEALDRRLTVIEEQRHRLARAIATIEDEEASVPILAELRQLGAQASSLKQERQALATQAAAQKEDNQVLTNVMSWCQRVALNLPALSYKEKRLVLEALGVSVRVFRSDHDPRWEITMAPLPITPTPGDPFVFSNPR